ncbi:unnamed protein product [Pleuronectes platessa]|uniref:Uncharacterized protein n=1 Tax=Pleuronectes platessa TaxID=8262 RepID=A0A9N7Y7D5_PLEPL|nr:unnamed protein product [Pleuronectes platessa]
MPLHRRCSHQPGIERGPAPFISRFWENVFEYRHQVKFGFISGATRSPPPPVGDDSERVSASFAAYDDSSLPPSSCSLSSLLPSSAWALWRQPAESHVISSVALKNELISPFTRWTKQTGGDNTQLEEQRRRSRRREEEEEEELMKSWQPSRPHSLGHVFCPPTVDVEEA